MAVTLPFPTLSGAIVSSQLDSNFSTLANKFGNIVNADIAAGAALDIDKLSAQYERMLLCFQVWATESDTAAVTTAADIVANRIAASLSALAAGAILDIIPLPGDSSDTNWQIYDVSWACSDTGNGATQVRVEWGYYSAVGVWTVSTTPVAAFALTNANAAQDANDGLQVNSSATTLDFNHATGGNTPRSLALVLNTQGVGTLSIDGSFLMVSLSLRRKIQAS